MSVKKFLENRLYKRGIQGKISTHTHIQQTSRVTAVKVKSVEVLCRGSGSVLRSYVAFSVDLRVVKQATHITLCLFARVPKVKRLHRRSTRR